MEYYLNTKTGTVHLVADIPRPRGNGFVQCGKFAKIALQKIRKPTNRQKVTICGRCEQLVIGDFEE
jgi:predicted PP-loop superfamily ATPase